MSSEVTRSKVIVVWFLFLALVVATTLMFGVSMKTETAALLAGLSLVPPALLVMLWPGVQPQTAAEGTSRRSTRMTAASFARIGALCALTLVVTSSPIIAQDPGNDFTRYREFQLGSSLSAVSIAAAVPLTDATLTHERPARLQDLTWRLSRWIGGSPTTDPVNQIRFSFYNDQLFRVVVEYASERTQGMTDADLIDALSASYGRPLIRRAGAAAGAPGPDLEGGTAVAHWGDTAHGVTVYRAASYGAPMRLVLTDVRVEGMARRAQLESQRLDDQEAPRRELERQKKERDAGVTATEKARETNKAAFRP